MNISHFCSCTKKKLVFLRWVKLSALAVILLSTKSLLFSLEGNKKRCANDNTFVVCTTQSSRSLKTWLLSQTNSEIQVSETEPSEAEVVTTEIRDHQQDAMAILHARDHIMSTMEVEDREIVTARISRGEMNFNDFFGVTLAMDQNYGLSAVSSPLASAPNGYELIIAVMSQEERLSPGLFAKSNPMASERIERISNDCGVSYQTVATFLSDFGSLQEFFAKVHSGKSKKGVADSMLLGAVKSTAESLATKSRRIRRQYESKSKLLKEAGKEIREQKNPANRGFG